MLVKHLLGLDVSPSFDKTTSHPFLKAIGEKRVSKDALVHYLAQVYAVVSYTYPRFIAELTAKLPPITPSPFPVSPNTTPGVGRKALELFALVSTNLVLELKFIEETVQKNLGVKFEDFESAVRIEPKETRLYVGELARVSSWASFEEGLVLLWAVEKVTRFLVFKWSFI